ncbi:MAG: hypothetical protein JXA52_06310 [Planctomycetes bacterium]|nr:hypothetical protein [Planctomycetota bacterium]
MENTPGGESLPREQIEELLDNATAGLKDDPELQLDVRSELMSHLEAAEAELRDAGVAEDKLSEEALKKFGSPVELADDLVKANRARMKLRALARLTARAVMVPLAVLTAVWVYYNSSFLGFEFFEDSRGISYIYGSDNYFDSQLSEEELLIMHGDKTRKKWHEQQRAIWEAEPENKVYYGNYISNLFTSGIGEREGLTREFLETEYYRGMELDPDNARYHYLLANLWLDEACNYKDETDYSEKEPQAVYTLEILDQELFDQAVAEILKGIAKPQYKNYVYEMAKLRLQMLPPSRTLDELAAKIDAMAWITLPDLSRARQQFNIIFAYAKQLAEAGRKEEACKYLEIWYPFATQLNRDSFTLVEVLVASAICKKAEEEIPPIYIAMAMPERAEKARDQAHRLASTVTAWREENKAVRGTIGEYLRREGSLLTAYMLPAIINDFDKEDLTPSRELEQTVLERTMFSCLLALFMGAMVASILIALRWRFSSRAVSPMLLLPTPPEFIKILGLGVILPVAVFWFYTRVSGLAGREFSVGYLGLRFLLEMILLSLTILCLTGNLAASRLRSRCRDLQIPVPEPGRIKQRVLWILLGASWLSCFFLREKETSMQVFIITGILLGVFFLVFYLPDLLLHALLGRRVFTLKLYSSWTFNPILMSFIVIIASISLWPVVGWRNGFRQYEMGVYLYDLAIVLTFIIIMVLLTMIITSLVSRYLLCKKHKQLVGQRDYASYYGTAARSLIPIFAGAVILLSLLVTPYLRNREARLLAQDPIFTDIEEEVSVSNPEAETTRELREGINRIAAEIEVEKQGGPASP